MAKEAVYTVGGTIQPGVGVYIRRKADDELLELCRAGEIAYILSSRQVGKSSLITQTTRQLEKENIWSVTVDLSIIGTKIKQDEWYIGIIHEIATKLGLKTDIFTWWARYAALGSAQRFFNFLRDVMLVEIQERIVLFFDEIDSTLSLEFADDFFATVRSTYNARAAIPDFNRLSFVLVGVATPSDLISDEGRTPFNIGHRVELNDFTREEAMPLAQGIGKNAEQVLSWILEWTGGHPYLTQKICAKISSIDNGLDKQVVARQVEELYLGEQGAEDEHLSFVRDLLLERSPDPRRVLITYGGIRAGKKIADDKRSKVKAYLKISGVVKGSAGYLVTRNRIYERSFDQKWVKENIPSAVPRRILLGSAAIVMLALLFGAYFAYLDFTRPLAERAAGYVADFQATQSPGVRLKSLAALIKLGDEYSRQARDLFGQLSLEQQKELFVSRGSGLDYDDQVTVINGVYEYLANDPDNNALMSIMGGLVIKSDTDLSGEIRFWLLGRERYSSADYDKAEVYYTEAINLKSDNSGVYLDRAQAYLMQGKEYYPNALEDLTHVLELDRNRILEVRTLILATDQPLIKDGLFAYLGENESKYPELTAAVKGNLQRKIYDGGNHSTLPGSIVRSEGDPPSGDPAVDEVYDHLGEVYEFFFVVYNRDSIDNAGAELVATVHYQTGYDNAFWNGTQLVFGDGDEDLPESERLFNRFTGFDIVATEFMWAINKYEARLPFSNQPGALLESFKDIFASVAKQFQLKQTADEANWIVGDELFTSNVNGVGIRSLKDPGSAYDDPILGKDPQPAHMDAYVVTTQDNGGVHINSGIPSRAFYLVATDLGGYAWEKAGRIWYVTFCDKLQPDSDFQDAANKTFETAGELYGVGSAEQEAVRNGWAGVGIQVQLP